MKHEDPLEDLLSSALIQLANTQKGRHAVRTARDVDTSYRACFTKAENWSLRSQVQLIHVEGNVSTLIGLYDELVHSYVPGCRRLIATATRNPALPQKGEEVRGEHWLPGDRLSLKRQPSQRTVELVLDLTLDMGQHLIAGAVLCVAYLVGGGLQRLCLLQDTVFEGSTPRTILQLPAGMDVLEGMTHASRMLAWASVQEQIK